jgi:sialic acid synthase SpsE
MVRFGAGDTESGSKAFRRSLYFVRDLPLGTTISADDIRAIRPGFGLAPSTIERIIGRSTRRSVTRGSPVTWDDF